MKKHRSHYSAFLKVITSIRLSKKISQKQLAEKLGANQSFVSKFESGERRVDLLELRQICSALDISLLDFVRELEKEIDRQQG
jgi:transcriptional regulator with XRE-family HTH domain